MSPSRDTPPLPTRFFFGASCLEPSRSTTPMLFLDRLCVIIGLHASYWKLVYRISILPTEMCTAARDRQHNNLNKSDYSRFKPINKIKYKWLLPELKQESRAVARKPRDAAAVHFGLKFADNVHYKFKSSQHSKARLQSSKTYTAGRKTEFNAK